MESNRSLPTAFQETVRKWKKRQQPPIFNGLGPAEDKNSDYLCPICFEMICEAHMTKCGHSFCYQCIVTSLGFNKKCPKCNCTIESSSEIFPNFLLNELIAKHRKNFPDKRKKFAPSVQNSAGLYELRSFLSRERASLTIEEVNAMLEVLGQKKQQLEADCRGTQLFLLKDFLKELKDRKREELKLIQQQLCVIDKDALIVEQGLLNCQTNIHVKNEASTSKNSSFSFHFTKQDGFNGSKYVHKNFLTPTFACRKKRMFEHFDELEQSYFNYRARDVNYGYMNDVDHGLDFFDQDLCKFNRYSTVRSLATLNYAGDTFIGSNIVSSIEFDKDNEYFAIAGVTKKIKVFEYGAVIKDAMDVHYAVNEMMCNSKISCLSWSSFHKSMLASSDYDGTVTLWDAYTSQKIKTFQEHEKRCWSVDFNKVDAQLLASGSDDTKVKLWATNMDHSFTSVDAKANVCCVKFNPENRNYLAFGSADHGVHYYDLRNISQSVQVMRGHKKAVSYVKFLNGREIVSASTDSQLKLWDVTSPYCVRSFKGHLNEKNFVGLATDGDFVACGSENNALYIYFKGFCTEALTFQFEAVKSILERDQKEEEPNEFVSSVCWRMGTNVVLAANSQGNIKILELV